MDGMHVPIVKPVNSGSHYYNNKNFRSVILFSIVNGEYEFSYINVGINGYASDLTVLQNSRFYNKLNNNDLHIPLRSALPLTDTIVMKPYTFKGITHERRIFNYRLFSWGYL